MPAGGPGGQSFLLDPSFLSSFLPLEKKLFFFLACEEQSVCVGPPAGRGEGEDEQTAGLAPGPGAGSVSDVSILGSGLVCLFGSTCEGKVSSGAGGPRSSKEEVWVS